jgi:CubicO group peptidase (beta-lactamase class C family)
VRLGAVLSATLIFAACSGSSELEPLRSPLALDASVEEIVTDLERFIPDRLNEAGVPGLSIALVRRGAVVWTEGFGLANTLTREPVTRDTVFEVASNSKAVAAYAALQLVGAGKLALDEPLSAYIEEPFLPASPQRDQVTLRRVLSHTSGLSNSLVGVRIDRKIYFPPGDRFSYSEHAFRYLQAVFEHVTDRPFGDHIQSSVLAPLGMDSSSYDLEAVRVHHAAGHLPAIYFPVVFGVLFVVAGIVIWPVAWLAGRFRRPNLHLVTTVNLVAAALLTFGFLGPSRMALVGLGVIALVLAAAFLAVRMLRISSGRARIGAAVAVAALGFVLTRPAIPLPVRPSNSLAAGGLRATARDLARFLIEAMEAPEMHQPQVRVTDHVSWGLGIGIQHGEHGDAIWHWGQNPGWQSLTVGYPEFGMGTVVLTNGGPPPGGLGIAREIAHRAMGGEHFGYWAEVPGTFLPAERSDAPMSSTGAVAAPLPSSCGSTYHPADRREGTREGSLASAEPRQD